VDAKAHWENIYQSKAADQVSWFQSIPERSLALIAEMNLAKTAPILDVGAGASTLVDHLLDRHYANISLLDISEVALSVTRQRLGEAAARLTWLEGDVTRIPLPAAHFAVWHDRAVFHFLSDAESQARYIDQVARALQPNGYAIIATFAHDGPTMCSGLPVTRYDVQQVQAAFGERFMLVHSSHETHLTPWNSEQKFLYCAFQATTYKVE
jgi:ubiquinone/menaquinone biosynthesis C-methylase UbiE